jgi:peptidoglycan/xylan/chitin deacetylase (PgdA/CDA1 family)
MSRRRALRRILPPRLRSRLLVSLTFDDGTADHLPAGRMLTAHGLSGTFYVNSNRIGSGSGSETLDWEGVRELAAAGHEIGGHTADHVDLTSVPAAEAREQIVGDRLALEQRGLEPRSFAYPYGAWNAAACELAAASGYTSGRRAWGLAGGPSPGVATESVPPADAFAIRSAPTLERETTLEALKGLVLRAEREGGWLPLVFHGVAGGDGPYDLPEAVFGPFVEWLSKRRAAVSVRRVGDVVEGG